MPNKDDVVPRLVKPLWPALTADATPLQQRCAIRLILSDERFERVSARLPRSEVDTLANAVGADVGNDFTHMQHAIVLNRIENRICNHCLNKRNVATLFACSACQMTFYCNTDCQRVNWPKHKQWCCQPDAAPDDGPMRAAVFRRQGT